MRGRGLLVPAFLGLLQCLAWGQARLDIVEKSDYHRYVGSANLGLVYRESRAYLHPASAGAWEGRVLVLEEVYRDAGTSSRKVDRSLELTLDAQGLPDMGGSGADGGFPSYRGLLAKAPLPLSEGQTWVSQASLALDPANAGDFVLLPVLVEYRVMGTVSYGGRQVGLVKAKFALRFGPGATASGLRSVTGSHDLDLYVEPEGSLVFLRDRFDETYGFSSQAPERHAGFTLVFYRGGPGSDRAGDIAKLSGRPGSAYASPPPDPSLSSSGPGPLLAPGETALDEGPLLAASPELARAGVDLLGSPEGLVLRIKDLHFVADRDEILPGESWRLDALAASLASFPGRSFLVEGHSAGVGRPAGELELSVLRAKRVVDELAARGIAAGRFVYRGLGSAKPLASNDSEAGRAANRRVEITILE
jgi:outer membrane protein OmpA-like peptidoglycan-associated protein